MPRLTQARYLKIHYSLRRLWLNHPRVYALLSSRQQLALHRYFVPYRDLPDAELLRYRQQVSAKYPSLPQRAGRAIRELPIAAHAYDQQVNVGLKKGERRIVLQAIVRPEPDVQALAKALLLLARAEAKAQLNREDHSPDAAPPRAA